MSDGMGIGGRRGMGGHHRAEGASDEWYTPRSLFDALGLTFDLDPAAPPAPHAPWIPARERYSLPDDGLVLPWFGRVWLNPPYGRQTATWMRRLAAHGSGVGLAFARADTAWFHTVAPTTHAVCLLRGRLEFLPGRGASVRDGREGRGSGAPSALFAFGLECAQAVANAGLGLTIRMPANELAGQPSFWESP